MIFHNHFLNVTWLSYIFLLVITSLNFRINYFLVLIFLNRYIDEK